MESIYFPNLGLDFQSVGQFFEINGIRISYFGMLLAIGMLTASFYIVMQAKRTGQNPNEYLTVIILAGFGAVVGARMVYLAFFWETVKEDWTIIYKVQEGGFALYGGILGGILVIMLYCCIRKRKALQMLDTVAMGVLILQIIGKWGNFFNRECFGDYTNNLVAMQIPSEYVRSGGMTELMKKNRILTDGIEFVQVHPTFLYESLWCLGLFFFLRWYRRKRKFDGEIFAVYLMGYSLGRCWLEIFRIDRFLFPGTQLPFFQIVAIVITVVMFVFILIARSLAIKKKRIKRQQREEEYLAEERSWQEYMEKEKKTENDKKQTEETI